MDVLARICRLAALLIVLSIVLSPLRAMAAALHTSVPTVSVAGPIATTLPGSADTVRREPDEASRNNTYDATFFGYDDPSNSHLDDGAGAVRAHDGATEHAEKRELVKRPIYDGPGATTAAGGDEAFAAHASMRTDLGLPAMGTEGSGALAKLEAGGQEFWGINAHGQSVSPLRVNAISATHAEGDAFAQAARAGVNGGSARLVVDRALCPACGDFGAVRSMARQLGFESLEVVTPKGTSTLLP